MRSSFVNTFICDNLLYKLIDNQIDFSVRVEIINIIKAFFEDFLDTNKENSDNYESYYYYIEGLINNELTQSYNFPKRMALSMVGLSFINYSIGNGWGDPLKIDLLESLAYKLLGE